MFAHKPMRAARAPLLYSCDKGAHPRTAPIFRQAGISGAVRGYTPRSTPRHIRVAVPPGIVYYARVDYLQQEVVSHEKDDDDRDGKRDADAGNSRRAGAGDVRAVSRTQ